MSALDGEKKRPLCIWDQLSHVRKKSVILKLARLQQVGASFFGGIVSFDSFDHVER